LTVKYLTTKDNRNLNLGSLSISINMKNSYIIVLMNIKTNIIVKIEALCSSILDNLNV